jgi:hypothetical protein
MFSSSHGQHSGGAPTPYVNPPGPRVPFEEGGYLSHASTLVRLSGEPPTLMQTDVIVVMSNLALFSCSGSLHFPSSLLVAR